MLAGAASASTGSALFGAALAGGRQALAGAGGLAVGESADLVSLKGDASVLVGRRHDAWLDAWIFAGGRTVIESVWRAGRQVVSAGRHVRRDSVEARYRAVLSRLLAEA